MVCIDTTFAIDVLRGKDEVVALEKKIDDSNETIYITTPTIMELVRGLKSNVEREKLNGFLSGLVVLDLDKMAAVLAGNIEAELISKGQEIASEDIMIAAIVIKKDEVLLTRNKKHFERIKGLKMECY
ncbi:MAG: PIN domain-containing protein [Nanoarchaeota archaeon]|nr:PIN domain-containing protein [Nanoarchaeota archaeon]